MKSRWAAGLAGVSGLAVGVAVATSAAWASIPDKSGEIHGCVAGGEGSKDTNPKGVLTVIDPSADCPSGDTAITLGRNEHNVSAIKSATHAIMLHKKQRTSVLTEKLAVLSLNSGSMWITPSVDLRGGAHASVITLRMTIDGHIDDDEPPIVQSVGSHSHQNLFGLLKCNGVPAGSHTVGFALTSSRGGVVVGARSLLAQTAGNS